MKRKYNKRRLHTSCKGNTKNKHSAKNYKKDMNKKKEL